jgi:hypothetical protein
MFEGVSLHLVLSITTNQGISVFHIYIYYGLKDISSTKGDKSEIFLKCV